MNNGQKTLKAISLLQIAYRDALPKERLKLFVMMLSDIDPVLLEKAVYKIIKTEKFMPSIAEIRMTAQKANEIETGLEDLTPEEAWGEVRKEIARVGYTRMPSFSTELLQGVVERFGWLEICRTPERDTGILQAQFRRAYESAMSKQKERQEFSTVGIVCGDKKQIANNKIKALTQLRVLME